MFYLRRNSRLEDFAYVLSGGTGTITWGDANRAKLRVHAPWTRNSSSADHSVGFGYLRIGISVLMLFCSFPIRMAYLRRLFFFFLLFFTTEYPRLGHMTRPRDVLASRTVIRQYASNTRRRKKLGHASTKLAKILGQRKQPKAASESFHFRLPTM